MDRIQAAVLREKTVFLLSAAGMAGLLFFTLVRTASRQDIYVLGEWNRLYYIIWFLTAVFFASSHRNRRRRRIWLAVLILLSIMVIFGDMRLSRIDECSHLDYICYVARTRRLPTMYQRVNRALMASGGAVSGLTSSMRYEAVQAPLYYVLMALPAMLIRNVRGIWLFCRCAGLLMWLASLELCERALQKLYDRKLIGNMGTALLLLDVFAANPGILIRCICVSNEPLTILLTVLLTDVTFDLLTDGWSSVRTIKGTVFAILLFYTKSTGVFVIGGMLLVLLYEWKIRSFILSSVSFAAAAVPWFLHNRRLYGSLTGMNRHIELVIDKINPMKTPFNLPMEIFTIFEKKYFLPAEVNGMAVFSREINTAVSVLMIAFLGTCIIRELCRLGGFIRRRLQFTYAAEEKKGILLMVCAALVLANIAMLALSTRSTLLNTLLGRYLYFLILPMSILCEAFITGKNLKRAAAAGAAVVMAVFFLDTFVDYAGEIGSQQGMFREADLTSSVKPAFNQETEEILKHYLELEISSAGEQIAVFSAGGWMQN